jgi:DNA recombination protein RmuC
MTTHFWLITLAALAALNLLAMLFLYLKSSHTNPATLDVQQQTAQQTQMLGQLQNGQQALRESFLIKMQEQFQQATTHQQQQIGHTLKLNADLLEKRLAELSTQLEKRLQLGFDKTTTTFTDVVKRLALIDEAQKKITELSTNVVSLQEILNDKRARGAFGEIQLAALVSDALPETHYTLQHTLSNGKRVDCMLFLPEPTGDIGIDAKFPLEGYQHLVTAAAGTPEYRQAQTRFKRDIQIHIQAIAEKYIIPGETADGAMMFIPSESVFAEIHSHFPEVVAASHRARVWLVSPTTMMAILTTARAVIKDAATRQQIHIIQDHIHRLAEDFQRFDKRMGNLARHIGQAQEDVQEVHTSAKKISSRFQKIEQVELAEELDEATE